MYEPITLVKVRKDTTIKIPAGGWAILCSPNQPLHEHVAERQKLVKVPTNEDYSELIIGRIQDVSPKAKFVSDAELEAMKKRQAAEDKKLSEIGTDAKKRQAAMSKEAAEAEQKAHEEKVAKLNEHHDAIRKK